MKYLERALALVGLAIVVAGLTGVAMSVLAPSRASAVTDAVRPARAEQLKLYVLPGAMGFVGPDGKHHDTIAPADFVLHRGVPVTFTIINYDDGLHAIYAPALGLNIVIEAGVHAKATDGTAEEKVTPTTTTFTFTPTRRGEFRWQCTVMCDAPSHWAMSDGYDGAARDGFMAGWIKVL